jgi:hypothetical protein
MLVENQTIWQIGTGDNSRDYQQTPGRIRGFRTDGNHE